MKGLIVLLVILLPTALFAQAQTGRYRTVKQSFSTIYSPKTYNGYIMQQEIIVVAEDSIRHVWNDLYYTRNTLFGKKKYNLWEIYKPIYK